MALHWPTFLTRTGSAVVFGVVMLVGLMWNEWMFLVLIAAIQALCLREYFKLQKKIGDQNVPKWVSLSAQVIGFLWIAAHGSDLLFGPLQVLVPAPPPHDYTAWESHQTVETISLLPALLFTPILLLVVVSLVKNTTAFAGLIGVAGLFYITLPCLLLVSMWGANPLWPLVLILCIWTNDTMAYIVGSLIGRTPFSSISPKKTWEGTAGGAILTIAGAATWAFFSKMFPVHEVVGVALCAAVFGTLGDLFESKLKRLACVKDSGNLMPGHGGALDRFDSLLIATPFAFCYLYVAHL